MQHGFSVKKTNYPWFSSTWCPGPGSCQAMIGKSGCIPANDWLHSLFGCSPFYKYVLLFYYVSLFLSRVRMHNWVVFSSMEDFSLILEDSGMEAGQCLLMFVFQAKSRNCNFGGWSWSVSVKTEIADYNLLLTCCSFQLD